MKDDDALLQELVGGYRHRETWKTPISMAIKMGDLNTLAQWQARWPSHMLKNISMWVDCAARRRQLPVLKWMKSVWPTQFAELKKESILEAALAAGSHDATMWLMHNVMEFGDNLQHGDRIASRLVRFAATGNDFETIKLLYDKGHAISGVISEACKHANKEMLDWALRWREENNLTSGMFMPYCRAEI
jgi:hypothetical protein